MPYKSDPGLIAALIALGMTVLGSVAAYAYKVLSGDSFSWRTLCLQLIVSVFAGFLMMLLATYWTGLRKSPAQYVVWLAGPAHRLSKHWKSVSCKKLQEMQGCRNDES